MKVQLAPIRTINACPTFMIRIPAWLVHHNQTDFSNHRSLCAQSTL